MLVLLGGGRIGQEGKPKKAVLGFSNNLLYSHDRESMLVGKQIRARPKPFKLSECHLYLPTRSG